MSKNKNDENIAIEQVTIRAYNKFWKIEQKIYSIFNLKMPAPIYPSELLYFIGILVTIIFLNKFFALVKVLPAIIKYLVIPIVMTKFLRNKKLDGKNPVLFFIDYLQFCLTKKSYIERHKIFKDKSEKYKVDWNIRKRDRYI